MSDNTATAPAPVKQLNIPTPPLTKKDEQGNVIASVTPTVEVIKRGMAEGAAYPVILVTKDTLNSYVKFRGVDHVLSVLNARERADAQKTLEYVCDDADAWEPVEGKVDAKGEPNKFTVLYDKFLAVIDKFYETLLSGRVRGGVTIAQLEEELADLQAEMEEKMQRAQKLVGPEQQALIMECFEISNRHKEVRVQIEAIRAERKPRKTKAQKEEEAKILAAKAAAGPQPTA